MKKGQGSLEYLLILAAILAIAVVVVVVANSMISAPTEQADLNQDKYECAIVGIELTDYTKIGGTFGVSYSDHSCGKDYVATDNAANCTLNNGIEIGVSYSAGVCNYLAS